MDFDMRTIFSIVQLFKGVKETYQSFTQKEKPHYRNRPQYQKVQNREHTQKPNRQPPQRHSFWI